MKKLILRNHLSPGDIVMLTAAVRDLHLAHPGQFLTDVRTSCSPLWENNPRITPLLEDDPDVEVIDCSYPLINKSNRAPYHCLHGFISFLNERLDLAIAPTAFRGDIHLSDQEKGWYSQVHELAGIDLPFWIIAAGGKYDITIKWWSSARYQEVVDHFRGKIQFVQIGAKGHYHPKLKGTIDLRGKTNLRELVRLVYHAQGVLCGVTAAMHLAAAVPTKPENHASRPCVVVAGGREPAHWEAYPDHQFISTNGTLACCSRGGCWRGRTVPLGDGDERDEPGHLCVDVVNDLPRCMDFIDAAEVCRRIELYFRGEVTRYLDWEQQKAAHLAVAQSEKNPYDETALTLHNARLALEKFARHIPDPPRKFEGRGIVICGGGLRYFTNAWVCVRILRQVGCHLPVELWHLGPDEMDPEMRALIEPYGVQCIDTYEVLKQFPVRRLGGGWQAKPFAILFSRFREVIYLDADNVPVDNPESLFDSFQYKETGAIFWPDLPWFNHSQVIWDNSGLIRPETVEFESGQVVIDKERCWKPMRLALWFNEHSDFYYEHIHGDKETFHLAFHKLRQPYGFVPTPIHKISCTMCQHDFEGRRIFQHRNTDKWNLFGRNQRIRDFWLEEDCFNYLRELESKWDGRVSKFLPKPTWGRLSAIRIEACMITCPARSVIREETLRNLRDTDWGDQPIHIQMDASSDPSPQARQVETAFAALEALSRTSATHVLFLEDDLEFNRNLLYNLSNWAPLRNGKTGFASLYNPGVRAVACCVPEAFSLMSPHGCFGSQSFILSREVLQYVVEHWNEIAGLQDIKISRLAGRLQSPIFYHTPSLVQHVGRESSWGGSYHRARDFDPDWKSPLLY